MTRKRRTRRARNNFSDNETVTVILLLNKAGVGALHLACLRGKTEAMDWLLSKGFNYCDIGKVISI